MKRHISIICILILLFSGCVSNEEKQSQHNGVVVEDDVHIVNFYKSYKVNERPRITPPPEDLPEGIVEYDDEDTFRLRNDETLNFIKYFPMDYEYSDISVIYEGDIPESVYDAAYEWISVLYEAEKLKDQKKMTANIKSRFKILSKSCVEFVEDKFMEKHVQSMYHYNDVKHCSLWSFGEKKVYFQGYKTHYVDFLNKNYYGITAEIKFEPELYKKARQVPNYIIERDMGFSLYVEILFDSENKIAGWIEEFHKNSEKEHRYTKFIVSPEKTGFIENDPYFDVVFDDSFTTCSQMNYLSFSKDMFEFEKELMYLLKANKVLDEKAFFKLKERCSQSLLNSFVVQDFYSEFLYDIKRYNVAFEFDPFTISELDEKDSTPIYLYAGTKYGDVYCYSSGGLKKTGSDQFNEKYALNKEGYGFKIEYYFVMEDEVPKLLGVMLTKNNSEYANELPEHIISLWNGIKPPVEEEQG